MKPTVQSKLPQVGTTIFTVMSSLAAQHGAINLSQGFPNFDPAPRLQRLVFQKMRAGANQYSPMPGLLPLRERIAEKFEMMYSVPIHPDSEVTITAGGTQAIFCTIAAFVGQGDEVLMPEPCYDSYRPSVETVGGVSIPIPLQLPDYQINWTDLGKKITPRTRMICLNTPQNPTGRTLKKSDWEALSALVRGTDIIVLSDEVYEHLIFDGQPHQTALAFPELRERTVAVYSFGKTFHNTGWKTGYTLAAPELTREFRKIHQFNVFSANHPIQAALAEFMREPKEYLSLPKFYQKKRDFFQKIMTSTRFRALPCEGTYFQLYDYSRISEEGDFDFCRRLTTDFGVAAIPVSSFFSDGQDERVVRFCFGKTLDLLEQAGELLAKV